MITAASKYLDKLPDDWQTKFLEMYDQGCSDHEIMREYGITPKAWQIMSMALGESEFNEVVDFGHALAKAWWEQQGRVNLNRKGFNVRLFDINMQNRYDWARKAEVNESEQVGSADEESLNERIKHLQNKVSGDADV